MSTTEKPTPLFSPGRIVYPPQVQRALRLAGLHGVVLLTRHLTGDWGQVDPKRVRVNRWAIAQAKAHNKPVISRFLLSPKAWVLIITRHLHPPGRRETIFILRREADTQPRPQAELANRNGQARRPKVKTMKTRRVK